MINIIIPAAGIGRRMKSYGPKALVKVNDKSIIEHQLTKLQTVYPGSKVYIVTGFEHDKIRNCFYQWHYNQMFSKLEIHLIYNPLYELTNNAYSTMLAMEKAKSGDYLIINGDVIFSEQHIKCLNKTGCVVDAGGYIENREIGVNINNDTILSFAYGSKTKWAQIAYLEDKHREKYIRIAKDERSYKWFTFEVFDKMINEGVEFNVAYTDSFLLEVDTIKDIR
jgi:choline kinase